MSKIYNIENVMYTGIAILRWQLSPDSKCPPPQEQLGEPEYIPSVLQVRLREEPGLIIALSLHLAEMIAALVPTGVSG